MRWCLALLVVLAACAPSRYGAYLTLQGDIEFDHVELYFGHTLESASTGLAFATPRLGPARGTAFGRKFVSLDQYEVDPTKDTTLYLPPDGQNEVLGAYVVAVVSRGDQPVGIGEYFDFKVPTAEVHEYLIDLVPYEPAKVERWGASPGCIAWARERGSLDKAVVGVVHPDDRDCDDDAVATDCNDLCTTGSTACDGASILCFTPCALGCGGAGGACVPKTCMPSLTCSSLCNKVTLTERYQCAADNQDPHVEIFVDTQNQQMCATTFLLTLPPFPSLPPQCLDPKIEFITVPPTDFAYTVSAEPQSPRCMLALDHNAPFVDKHHMIISFASQEAGKPRKSVVVGVQPMPVTSTCDPNGYRVENTGPIFDCN